MSGKREEFITPRTIVIDQVERYQHWMLLSSLDRSGEYRKGSIGETIRRLSPAEREKLQHLKSDDIKNVRSVPISDHPFKRCPGPQTSTRVFRIPHTKS